MGCPRPSHGASTTGRPNTALSIQPFTTAGAVHSDVMTPHYMVLLVLHEELQTAYPRPRRRHEVRRVPVVYRGACDDGTFGIHIIHIHEKRAPHLEGQVSELPPLFYGIPTAPEHGSTQQSAFQDMVVQFHSCHGVFLLRRLRDPWSGQSALPGSPHRDPPPRCPSGSQRDRSPAPC